MDIIPLNIDCIKWIKTGDDIFAKFIMECTGCMIFHFVGSVAPNALANAIVLLVLVYYTSKVSGAHLNPAVSLTFTVLGHTTPVEMLIYWAAQILGCIFGALWIACLVPNLSIRGHDARYDGCFIPDNRLNRAEIFGWEALCTFNFILPIFAVVWYTEKKSGYGNTGPFIVGMSLLANALACGQWTGGALNPARVLGSPAVFDCGNTQQIFYYIIGELTGALAASLAIIPWYGISDDAWYLHTVPKKYKEKLILFQPFPKPSSD